MKLTKITLTQDATLKLVDIYTKQVNNDTTVTYLFFEDDEDVLKRVVTFDANNANLILGQYYDIAVNYSYEYDNYRLKSIRRSDNQPQTSEVVEPVTEEQLSTLSSHGLNIPDTYLDVLLLTASKSEDNFKIVQAFLAGIAKAITTDMWDAGKAAHPHLLRSAYQKELKTIGASLTIQRYVPFELVNVQLNQQSKFTAITKLLHHISESILKEEI